MDKEKIICDCQSITVGDLEEAIANQATTFEEIQEETSVSMCCGSCEATARKVCQELLEGQEN